MIKKKKRKVYVCTSKGKSIAKEYIDYRDILKNILDDQLIIWLIEKQYQKIKEETGIQFSYNPYYGAENEMEEEMTSLSEEDKENRIKISLDLNELADQWEEKFNNMNKEEQIEYMKKLDSQNLQYEKEEEDREKILNEIPDGLTTLYIIGTEFLKIKNVPGYTRDELDKVLRRNALSQAYGENRWVGRKDLKSQLFIKNFQVRNKHSLLSLKAYGEDSVRISGSRDNHCKSCKKLIENSPYSFLEVPILPNLDCTHKRGFCRCLYSSKKYAED